MKTDYNSVFPYEEYRTNQEEIIQQTIEAINSGETVEQQF